MTENSTPVSMEEMFASYDLFMVAYHAKDVLALPLRVVGVSKVPWPAARLSNVLRNLCRVFGI